ncbi:MFS transporter [Mesorhizobium sp. M7A.T.Ca.TU.009.01.3.2]|jgi:MFS family permease|uniref:MFS transporter n=1 Tax=unclassified Mesorhizobium TaxID=325217 RepID=UPI000FCB8E87|nr:MULTISPECIES: MFS transporter [unclassified Mesorhizobium]RUU24440.1 MFS transporter [Mesorhizobium sp. M7A.T.Ca.TU.009.01.3.2]RUU73235.1 MFS transporter [Mesorhizobium sp. M7A.T.Ca.TU.009.01.1.2]RUV11004.1 MFS transporter [Mesorhizobium sp. M7A.T.Ca.TU.009.01.3.1]RUT85916.1 MFS transporter [Mesorhizobium sp. M7A.T.Ca.US.000.02.1.1]RUT87953.1 MFS transporter [Mesorhizobium sp. M7A.T.Ca.US.000.02.2.1]
MSLSYRWVIVAAGALMSCVAIGTMFSLAIFLEPMAIDTNWSRAGISSAMTLNFLVMGLGGFAWGAISDRFGARIVVMIGAVLLGLALVLASRAGSLLSFQITYGVLVGLAASAFFAPMIALTTGWFDTNRSLAVSLVSAGMGVAPMTISPFARWLISAYDWRTAMFDIGITAWVLLLPAVLLVRQPPKPVLVDTGSAPVAEGAGLTVGQALRSPQFIVLGLTFFACCAAHSGPIFHMVSYAMLCGVAPMAAVSIYSVEGLAGLGGRLFYGVLADRLGVKPVLIAGLAIQAIVIAAYLSISQLEQFYMLAVIFGATYGGVMPLYAVLAREYFGQRILGTVFGAATMLSSLGMALGPLAGGMVFDAYANYSWLFIGSALIGLGAVGIAIAFPPLPRRELQPA